MTPEDHEELLWKANEKWEALVREMQEAHLKAQLRRSIIHNVALLTGICLALGLLFLMWAP